MFSGSTGDSVVHSELKRWRRGNPMQLLNEDGVFAESGRIVSHISVNLLLAMMAFSDVISYIYPPLHSA